MFDEVIKEFQEKVKELSEKASRICVAIVYGRKLNDEKIEIEVASGFLYEHQGSIGLVTAGHVLDDEITGIRAWSNDGSLTFVDVVFRDYVNTYVSVPMRSFHQVKTWSDEGCDLGCILLGEPMRRLMYEKGMSSIPTDQLMVSELSKLPVLVLGFPAIHARTADINAFSIISEGERYDRIYKNVVGLGYSTIVVKPPTDKSTPVLSSGVYPKTPSFSGMSGGIVIELFERDGEIIPSWLGIQSSQTSVARSNAENHDELGDRRPVEINYLNSLLAREKLNNWLGEATQ